MTTELDPSDDNTPRDYDRLIIAVDFGTTFASVAYAKVNKGMRGSQLGLEDVQCINRYAGYRPPLGAPPLREDVPTELWYDPNPESRSPPPLAATQMEVNDERPVDNRWKSLYPDSDEESGLEVEQETSDQDDNEEAFETSRPRCWGFGVQNHLKKIDIPKDNARRITRFKLLLDESEATKEVRDGLVPTLKALQRRKLIQKEEDLFAHYLTHLLENTRNQLQKIGELDGNVHVEFVLCVPAKWPTKGCRVLQAAMRIAAKEAGFGNDGVCNLFMVSEPESAAACVLAENRDEIYFGEVIVILDAGGGTIDAVTYEITNEEPLRMHAEIAQPDSELQGGSYINQRFAMLLTEKLGDEQYLVKNGKTIKSIVEAQTMVFENGEKRTIDTVDKHASLEPIYIDDVKENSQKGLYTNRVAVSQDELNMIFCDSLRGAKEVLKRQLQTAESKGKAVNKVILTGGFGHSPALRHYLRNFVRSKKNVDGREIVLLTPNSPSTAVARGAVLRALKKNDGPSRITQCSYGFLRTEPYEPHFYEAHKRTKPRIDPVDGERYVHGTIDWLIKAGDELPPRHRVPITVKHTFNLARKHLICKEVLWVSDQKLESHYRHSHPNNRGAERAGHIVADMTFLKDRGLIQPEAPSHYSTFRLNPQRRHWVVNFELVMIVDGRNLRYEARWPPTEDLEFGEEQTVHAVGQECIAAAFQPGTA
ncbi:hypothetical protein K469DRAFT_608704 [Zopfia rhizophila CBS 207.26]|uniref:Actin-like ATPase domain-containing protein n=1 Tax=Zopfia rhizophila CBS 207.26 TaxID=1314779 RepID=A0A6A6DBZ9_9PEZI|nr:hypothetical protein K469DRAFT_608704 [Zopfia rhizophila CBS 207.26]